MRPLALLAPVVLAVTACGVTQSQPSRSATDAAGDVAAVETALTQWFDSGIGVVDTARIRAGLVPGAAILEDSIWYDASSFIAFLNDSLPKALGGPFTIKFTLSDWRTSVQGDVAWTTLRNRAVVTPTSGEPMPLDWRETAVLKRVDGKWLIDRYHSASVH
jgi:hypothetical protein